MSRPGKKAPRFLDSHARANRQKPSTIVTKESLLRVNLAPLLGAKRLDAITNEDVQRVKRALSARPPKTVNNVLSVLRPRSRGQFGSSISRHLISTVETLWRRPIADR